MDKIAVIQDTLWAGTELALAQHIQTLSQLSAKYAAVDMTAAGVVLSGQPQQEEPLPYLLSIDGEAAIINVKGPTTNQDQWWFKYENVASYNAIREALIRAAETESVKFIILDIDSGGGAVSGIADVGSLIQTIDTEVKPVYAFTDGSMYSAAYWLGCSAREVYCSKVAGVGSIGVIATHMEISKMYEEMGINVTVIRSGKYKALANRFEPLTDAAKEQIQESLDAAYVVFAQHVSDSRGVPYATVDSKMAQGKEFFGEQALTAGLVDGMETFDSLMSKLKAKSVDSQKSFSHNPTNVTQGNLPMKKALSATQIAALASGAPLTTATAAAPVEAGKESTTEQAATETTATEASTEATTEATTTEQTTEAQAAAATPEANIVTFLQGQVKDKDAALLTANVELNALKAKVADLEASTSGLMTIAATSVNHMRVALGGSAVDLSALSATALLAEHKSFSDQFNEKFKTGGVAAVDAAEKKTAATSVSAVERARLDATRIVPKSSK